MLQTRQIYYLPILYVRSPDWLAGFSSLDFTKLKSKCLSPGFLSEDLGRIDFQAHSGSWQTSVPYADVTEVSLTLLAVS